MNSKNNTLNLDVYIFVDVSFKICLLHKLKEASIKITVIILIRGLSTEFIRQELF